MRSLVAAGSLVAALACSASPAHAAERPSPHQPPAVAALDPLRLAPDPTVVALATQTQVTALAWSIAASAVGSGTISPSGTVTVPTGLNQTFTMTPASCNVIRNVQVDGIDQGPLATYTFQNVTSGHTIVASFSTAPADSITATAGVGGAISPAGLVVVTCGSDQTFTITPADCHLLGDVWVDGISQGAVIRYTFQSVSASHTIAASFVPGPLFAISASAGSHGSITPPGTSQVTCGSDRTYSITPDNCFLIADVAVDGVSQGPLTSYTFTNVRATHAISASFVAGPPYAITASAGSGGTIAPAGVVVSNCGSSRTFTIAHDACYQVVDVVVDGVSQGALRSYTFVNVLAPHTIAASFAPSPQYTITAGAGAGGSIDPAGQTQVNCGSDQTFTITPAPGNQVTSVLVDGSSRGAVLTYTFTNVNDAHTIFASFASTPPPISVALSPCLPSGARPVVSGGPLSPNTSYRLDVLASYGFPPPAGLVLGNAGSAQTDQTGFIVSSDLSCDQDGAYTLILDVTGDGLFEPGLDAFAYFRIGNAVATTGLQDIEATIAPDGPTLTWWLMDLDTYRGFLIHRAPEGGDETLVTPGPLALPSAHPPVQVRWHDASAVPGTRYAYRIEALKPAGADWYGPVALTVPLLPQRLALRGATPNPFHGATRLEIDTPLGAGPLRLDVFDITGRRIRVLREGTMTPGQDVVDWDGLDDRGVPVRGGIYVVRLQSGLGTSTTHLVKMD